MTSPGTAVIEFPTSEPAKDCLKRGVFTWDCGDDLHMLKVEKIGKNLFIFPL